VKDSKQKEIILYHPDIERDKKDAVSVRYLLNGMKMHIVPAVTLN
jgi:hypothetical protein